MWGWPSKSVRECAGLRGRIKTVLERIRCLSDERETEYTSECEDSEEVYWVTLKGLWKVVCSLGNGSR